MILSGIHHAGVELRVTYAKAQSYIRQQVGREQPLLVSCSESMARHKGKSHQQVVAAIPAMLEQILREKLEEETPDLKACAVEARLRILSL